MSVSLELSLVWGLLGLVFSGAFLKFSLLLILVLVSLFTTVSLILFTSMWLGVVFFLIYVGALLVLFFFIGSLDNNHLPEMENLWFGGFFSVALVMGFGSFSFLPFHSSEVFFNLKEGLALKGDMLSLLSLLIFVCLVVWNLNSLNWKKNSPLRPFC